jgi:hypothetical protein
MDEQAHMIGQSLLLKRCDFARHTIGRTANDMHGKESEVQPQRRYIKCTSKLK